MKTVYQLMFRPVDETRAYSIGTYSTRAKARAALDDIIAEDDTASSVGDETAENQYGAVWQIVSRHVK